MTSTFTLFFKFPQWSTGMVYPLWQVPSPSFFGFLFFSLWSTGVVNPLWQIICLFFSCLFLFSLWCTDMINRLWQDSPPSLSLSLFRARSSLLCFINTLIHWNCKSPMTRSLLLSHFFCGVCIFTVTSSFFLFFLLSFISLWPTEMINTLWQVLCQFFFNWHKT